jgi:leader peptidase (prepilin peptidase)/N-methyltransferase
MLFELICLFFLSLSFSSFLNVIILSGKMAFKLDNRRSECPNCSNKLFWYHNIPIFSYIFLKGKCYFCKENISSQYPIIEFFGSIILPLSFYLFGFSISTLLFSVILFFLLFLSVKDFKYKYVTFLDVSILLFLLLLFGLFYSQPIDILFGSCFLLVFLVSLKLLFDFIKGTTTLGVGDIIPLLSFSVIIIKPELILFEISLGLFIMSIIVIVFSKFYNSKEIPLIPFIFLALLFKTILLSFVL